MPKAKPEPYYEDGYFVPSAPVPRQIEVADYKRRHAWESLFLAVRNPLETFSALQYRVPVYQYMLAGSYFSLLSDPGAIKHVMIEKRHNYRMSNIRQRILKPIIGNGLIAAEGEEWQHARRIMSPMFTPRNVSTFAQTMKETCESQLPSLFDAVARDQTRIKAGSLLSALTYNVLSDTLFSGEIEREKKDVIKDVSTALLYMGRPDPFDLIEAPEWLPRLTTLRGVSAIKRIRKAIGQISDRRREQMDSGQDLPDDFLSRLLLAKNEDDSTAFNPQQIEDHLISFIGAGHETTARALVWLLYLLANDTDVRDRLEAEVDALDIDGVAPEDWVECLPFTKACLEETMRLYPPAPIIAREAIEDDQYGTTYIPGRTYIMIVTWILHRREGLWERPNAFDPDRFMGEARAKINRFQYLPFGAGERVCIGQRFAMQEAMILIASLLRNYRFDYAGDKPPWPNMRITVQPDNDMPMTVTKRV